jgi:uncharacterized repeat protein (TIGR01451 family)
MRHLAYYGGTLGGALLVAWLWGCGGEGPAERSPAEPEPLGVLSGLITEAGTGFPLADATVQIGDDAAPARTAADGTYSIEDLPPGTYAVAACKDGFACASATAQVRSGAPTTLDLGLAALAPGGAPAATGSAAGFVRLRDGRPAPAGTPVALHPDGPGCEAIPAVSVVTDASGRFLASRVPAGLYMACARAELGRHGYSGRRGLAVDPGVTSQTDLTLDPEALPLSAPTVESEDVVLRGARFELHFTVVGDGTGVSRDVAIADTLPLLDDPAGPPVPGDRDGGQAFRYVTDRPTFDPDAIRYFIDLNDDDGGTASDLCVEAPVPLTAAFSTPALCGTGTEVTPTEQLPTIADARARAEELSGEGHQVVVVEYFDAELLARTPPDRDLEAEDSFAITVDAIHSVNEFRLPGGGLPARGDENGEWCNQITATSAENDFVARETCTRVVEPLLEVRKTAADALVTAGGQTSFRIEIGNLGSADLAEVTVVDSLDLSFFSPPTGDPGLVRLEGLCAGCSVTFNADSSALAVAVPAVPSTDANSNGRFDDDEGFAVVDVVVRTPLAAGPFCNRVTAATPDGPPDSDLSCVVADTRVELDIANDDGKIQGGGFTDVETFTVGDTVAYQTRITNRSAVPATGVTILWEIAPDTGTLQLGPVLLADPPGIACDQATDSCRLNLASLTPGASVALDYLALAGFPGSDVNRITIAADGLPAPIVNEEPTTVGP